jgi:hypothetical protein
MTRKNPLSGKAYFDTDGNLWLTKGIPFGGQLDPKINHREWFYLLIEACKERPLPQPKVFRFLDHHLGSKVTQWRTKKSLIQKGYL